MTSNLGGIHDRQGAHIVPTGGYCVDTIALSENPAPTDYTALRGDINWIVRVNWGYGSTGTIPLPDRYPEFAAACAEYVAKSNGANVCIIGNEPQHEQERPNGVYITPAQYAQCFKLCRDAIKRVKPSAQVLPAPCAPYHANPTNWLEYWREMLTLIVANGGCDGIAVHAYLRSSNPTDVTSNARMGAPLQDTFSGFRTYIDALFAVPDALDHLPAYITECNELLPDGWHDANTGVVQAVFEEVDDWNSYPHRPQIHCVVLYRFPKFDKWHIEGKQGVIDDFRAACTKGYTAQAKPQEQQFMPSISTGASVPTQPPAQPQATKREFDPRLKERGVSVDVTATHDLAAGKQFWRVVNVRWFDESEAGGRHHIYVEALDVKGEPLPAVPFVVSWPGGAATEHTKRGRGFDAGNFAMSPSRNEFSVSIQDGASEKVQGIGMGADTPGGWNSFIHTSALVTFQRTVAQAQPTAPTPIAPPVDVLPLTGEVITRKPSNIRHAPNFDSGIITVAPIGTRYTLTGDAGEFYEIAHATGKAYVHESVVSRVGTQVMPEPTHSTDWLVTMLARVLGVEVPLAKALLQVESGGHAFDSRGRLVIRIELHVFRKYLNNDALFGTHFYHDPNKGHLDQKWRRNRQDAWKPAHIGTRDFDVNQANEWEVFNLAASFNRTAAYLSSSLGAAQIMAFNHALVGYSTPEAMFTDYAASELAQVAGLFAYCHNKPGMIDAMRRKDFVKMGALYNGDGAHYGPILEAAYSQIKAGK